MKFKNGREIKNNDPVVGLDWRNCPVSGTAITGDPARGHPQFVFRHGVHKTVCPSLVLTDFLHADDAQKAPPVAKTDSPAPAIAEA